MPCSRKGSSFSRCIGLCRFLPSTARDGPSTPLRTGSVGLLLVNSLKNSGTKKIARKVAASMPPITPVPIEWRRAGARAGRDRERQDAEDEGERGHQDRPEAQPRRLERRLDGATAPRAAAAPRTRRSGSRSSPRGRSASPGRSGSRRRSRCRAGRPRASAPNTANGTARSTASGSDQRSYCAARIRNTMTSREREAPDRLCRPVALLLIGRHRSSRSCSRRAASAPRSAPSPRAPGPR